VAALTVSPDDEEQISRLLRLASANGYGIMPQGGGTKSAYGGVTDRADILLSLKKLSGILHHSVGDLMVTALPGTTVEELQETLRRQGQFLPIDPAWSREATIGGITAANASGPKRALYGSARDHLVASRVVLADGTIMKTGAKVVKNVAGYDMNKLFVGSMGTLGVFTELTFKIRPVPASAGLIAFGQSPGGGWRELHEALLDSQLEPCAAELVGGAAAEELFGSQEQVFLIAFEDVDSSVQYQLDWVKNYAAAQLGLKQLAELRGQEAVEPCLEQLRRLTPNANDVPAEHLAVSLKLLSSLTDVPGICEYAHNAAKEAGLSLKFSGGLYTGISQASVTAGWDRLQEAIAWIKRMNQYMDQLDGSAVLTLAPRQVRMTEAVWGTARGDQELMRGVKRQFDPALIMNRGRFVGGI
jgi:glycolate oxidase FAD binding subunit